MYIVLFDQYEVIIVINSNWQILISGQLISDEGEEVKTVAIKVLKDSANKEAEEDFLREVEIMSAFRHSNILSLLGVVLKGM